MMESEKEWNGSLCRSTEIIKNNDFKLISLLKQIKYIYINKIIVFM